MIMVITDIDILKYIQTEDDLKILRYRMIKTRQGFGPTVFTDMDGYEIACYLQDKKLGLKDVKKLKI